VSRTSMKNAVVMALALAASVGTAEVAHAQATRTWISGVGDDVNPCSRTAPCKTVAGALSKTASGGEIAALDELVLGTFTVIKPIIIDGHGLASLNAAGDAIKINITASARPRRLSSPDLRLRARQ